MENPFSYFHIGNLLVIDLIAAGTHALNGTLLDRNPSHYRGNYWTVVGILSPAIFGGIGGVVVRDVMLAQVPPRICRTPGIYSCARWLAPSQCWRHTTEDSSFVSGAFS